MIDVEINSLHSDNVNIYNVFNLIIGMGLDNFGVDGLMGQLT